MAQYLYNGVLLPEIPADGNAYHVITKVTSTGYYCLYSISFSCYRKNEKLYSPADSNTFGGTLYAVKINEAENATSWGDGSYGVGEIAVSTSSLIWSDWDIPNGSADSTEIYFYGSEPVDPNAPEEPTEEVYYKISGARLTSIANAIRGKTGKEDSLTLEQMVTEIEGIEAGGIPENARLYYVGNADSEFTLPTFNSSAVGDLQEG